MGQIKTDFLVIGSGIAGLSAAITLAEQGSVLIVTKKNDSESNTNYAQGGIAAVMHHSDSSEQHISDTIKTGYGLSNEKIVRKIVERGPELIRWLEQMPIRFTRNQDLNYSLGLEGGHSQPRIVRVGDHTGFSVEKGLLVACHSHPRIEILENHTLVELLNEHQSGKKLIPGKIHCYGAYILDDLTQEVTTVLSYNTILATGGAGQIYLHTTNPEIATGDGIAVAYRAGCRVADMEFMQFHPTKLYDPEGKPFLISETVRGFGGILLNHRNQRFMESVDPRRELAPRDIVARAIDRDMKINGENHVYLDISHLNSDEIINRFPLIYKTCLERKIDITQEPIPVVPAAHYICGGVMVDETGKTDVHNLYAAGETACTGIHGANRLASNSLLEALYFGKKSAESAIHNFKKNRSDPLPSFPDWDKSGTYNHDEWVIINHDRRTVQSLMWDYVGIVRSNFRLERALRRLQMLYSEIEDYYRKTTLSTGLLELRNIDTVAYLVAKSALLRKESRGLHYTTDFPESDEKYLKQTILCTLKSRRE